MPLQTLTPAQLNAWITQARSLTHTGHLPKYVPMLAQVNPESCAVWIERWQNHPCSVGEIDQKFVLMSVIKPFTLLFLLNSLGHDAVFDRVGTKPSTQPYNSLHQLEADRGHPRNPMINSGAIVLADLLPGQTATSRCQTLCQWLNQQAGCHLKLDKTVLASVRSLTNETNWKLANRLAQAGYLQDVALALDTYNQICCLSGTVGDLARLGLLLAQPNTAMHPAQNQAQAIVNHLMLTCGLYEASSDYAKRIGLPLKSGVSGALLAVMPGEGAIGCYSPALDAAGNSIAGLFVVEQATQAMRFSH